MVTVRAVFDRENSEDKKNMIEKIASEKLRKIKNIMNAFDPEKNVKDPKIVIKSVIEKAIIK